MFEIQDVGDGVRLHLEYDQAKKLSQILRKGLDDEELFEEDEELFMDELQGDIGTLIKYK